MATRPGSSIVTDAVHEPRPPRAPVTMQRSTATTLARRATTLAIIPAIGRPTSKLTGVVQNGDTHPGAPSHEPGQPQIRDPQLQVEGSYAGRLGAPKLQVSDMVRRWSGGCRCAWSFLWCCVGQCSSRGSGSRACIPFSSSSHRWAVVPLVAVAASWGRSHSEARVGCMVWSTTASSSPVNVSRSISWWRRVLKVATVWAVS